MIRGRNIDTNTIQAANMAADVYKYGFERFPQAQPVSSLGTSAGGAVAGATGSVNVFRTNNLVWEQHIKGAGQTKIVPTMEIDGMEIALDLTDNEGAEYTHGILAGPLGPYAFTIKTDKDFFIRGKFKIADVSGTDEFLFGYRKAQAYAAAHGTYTDYSALGIVAAANPASVRALTDLNDGGEVSTDTTKTWADAEVHTVEVRISGLGVSTFYFDGVPVAVQASITHDTGDVMIPFIFYLHATTAPGKVHLQEYEYGYLDSRRAA